MPIYYYSFGLHSLWEIGAEIKDVVFLGMYSLLRSPHNNVQFQKNKKNNVRRPIEKRVMIFVKKEVIDVEIHIKNETFTLVNCDVCSYSMEAFIHQNNITLTFFFGGLSKFFWLFCLVNVSLCVCKYVCRVDNFSLFLVVCSYYYLYYTRYCTQ